MSVFHVPSMRKSPSPSPRRARVVGVSAGASTPEDLVAGVVDHFRLAGAVVKDVEVLEERLAFELPESVAVTRTGYLHPQTGA